jgi:hypothetical protein
MEKYSDITRLDWEILDALSDDYECVEHIEQLINDFSGISTNQWEVLDRLEYLHQHHYVFLLLNEVFDKAKIGDEIRGRTQNKHYWFGRTEAGYSAWKELADKYAG